jgi:hypothetical protein
MECVEGSEGPLCGACKEGWRYSSQDRKCDLCLGVSLSWVEVQTTSFIIIIIIYSDMFPDA